MYKEKEKGDEKLVIMIHDISYILFMYFLPVFADTHEKGYCSFPQYLWTPLSDGNTRKWISKTEYVGNTDMWERQKEIYMSETEMIIKHKVHASCNENSASKSVPCFRKGIVYRLRCIAKEPGDKFRVQQLNEHGHKGG